MKNAITYYAIASRGQKFGMLIVEKETGRPARQTWTGEEYDTRTDAVREMTERNAKVFPQSPVVF